MQVTRTIDAKSKKPKEVSLPLPNKNEAIDPILPVAEGQVRKFINMEFFDAEYDKKFGEPGPDWLTPLYEQVIQNNESEMTR